MTTATAADAEAHATPPDEPHARRWDRLAWVAIGAGAIFRVAWTLGWHRPFDHVYSDMLGYVDRASRLAAGGPFDRFDTFYPPGTHVLLALPFKIFGRGDAGMWAGAILWSLLSAVIPLLAWRVARRLIGPRAGAITGILAAAWPLFIAYGGFFLSETPSIAVLLGAILLGLNAADAAGRRRVALSALTGVLCGIAIVLRPQLGLNVLVIGWLLLRGRGYRWRTAAVAGIGLLLPIAGIVAMNSAIRDRPTVSENAAVNFFHAHCPVLYSYYLSGPGYLWFAAPPSVALKRGHDYVFPDLFPTQQGPLFREGFRCIRDNGIGHVGVVLRNIADMGRTTVPWPPSNEPALKRFVGPANELYAVILAPVAVGGYLLMRRKQRAGLPGGEGILVLHLVPLLPMGAFFVGDPRYRMAYDAFGLALAAAMISWGITILQDRRHARRAAGATNDAGPADPLVEH